MSKKQKKKKAPKMERTSKKPFAFTGLINGRVIYRHEISL